MNGLNYGTTRTFSGAKVTGSPQMWPAAGPSAQAFGAGYVAPVQGPAALLSPTHGFGVALWAGVGALGLLVAVRYLLPN